MKPTRGSSYRLALVLLSLLFAKACGFERPELLAPNPDAGDAGAPGVDSGGSATSGGAAGSGGSATGGSSGAIGTGGDTDTGGGAGDDSAAGTGGSAPSCTDFTADLCMKLTWPAAIVPYQRDAEIDEDLWTSVEDAIDMWRATPVLSSELEFVFHTGTVSIRPSLVFTNGTGCGIVGRSADELTFALGSCARDHDIAREIGVALGLPRMHQRTDRDRYLVLAPQSAFDCEKGQFYDKCAGLAEVGRFRTDDLMFAPPSSYSSPEVCELAPDGDYLYLRGSHVVRSSETVQCGYPTDSTVLMLHQRALTELYATARGWSPFRPVGTDHGPDRPLQSQIAADVLQDPAPSVVRWEGGATSIFTWARDTGVPDGYLKPELWRINNNGSKWGDWVKGPPAPLLSSAMVLPRADSPAVDVIVFGEGIFHAVLDDTPEVDWTLLGPLPTDDQVSRAFAMTAARTDAGSMLIYVFSGDPYDPYDIEVRVTETDGSALSEWEIIPTAFYASNPAVVYTDGEQHLVASRSPTGIGYVRKDAVGWSEWIVLLDAQGWINDVAITSTSSGRLEILAADTFLLWQISCERDCSSSGSWSSPVLVGRSPLTGAILGLSLTASGTGLDLAASIVDSELGGTTLWHKRWRPFDESLE
jgi:hypothetical protein